MSYCLVQRLSQSDFRRLMAWLTDWLSTLRSADYSNTTQDSIPVAGEAQLDGLSTRSVPLKGFRVVDYTSSSSPNLAQGVSFASAIRYRPAGASSLQPRNDPGHFRVFTGSLAIETHADVAASDFAEMINAPDILMTPFEKSSTAVLSPRLSLMP